ncbi:protein of unknown function [Bartonella clarridgeiae 73]|uniref:Uncharacterized protein n=1 Tax=Bartonella clarridgeiae (strain CCUG 45776 / CIP 104772 / 73) TaxID=696125 RepID=E6YIE5_BARC7|nr:protein of unknown function [Bartonella clarridgeiae 73]
MYIVVSFKSTILTIGAIDDSDFGHFFITLARVFLFWKDVKHKKTNRKNCKESNNVAGSRK